MQIPSSYCASYTSTIISGSGGIAPLGLSSMVFSLPMAFLSACTAYTAFCRAVGSAWCMCVSAVVKWLHTSIFVGELLFSSIPVLSSCFDAWVAQVSLHLTTSMFICCLHYHCMMYVMQHSAHRGTLFRMQSVAVSSSSMVV